MARVDDKRQPCAEADLLRVPPVAAGDHGGEVDSRGRGVQGDRRHGIVRHIEEVRGKRRA